MHMKWSMNKQNMVYPHDGILFYYKNEQKPKKKKRTKALLHAILWMNLENIMLSQTNPQRPRIEGFHLYEIGKSTDAESRLVVA